MTPEQLKAAIRVEVLRKDAFTSNGAFNTIQALDILIDEFSAGGGGGADQDLDSVLTAGNSANGKSITNLLDPSADQEAATKKYVDDNAGGGGGGITDITYANLLTAISGSTLSPGTTYKITDRGDMGIFLQAISTNQLTRSGVRLMLCPTIYAETGDWIGVWNINKSPVIGSLVIWGGLVWENNSGSIGTADDDVTLSGADWTVIPKASFSNDEYIEMKFGVSFDIENDWIEKQWDGNGNIMGVNFASAADLEVVYNYCDVTDWNLASASATTFFRDNQAFGVFNNNSGEGVYGNVILNGTISGNNNNGVFRNFVQGGVTNNSNDGRINDNFVFRIENNSNDGDIADLIVPNNVTGNSNLGDITHVICNQVINDNTHDGAIEDILSNLAITGNSGTGDITGVITGGIQEFADNAAAITGNLLVGQHYRTGDVQKIVHI